MTVEKLGYFSHLVAALLGRDLPSAAATSSDETVAQLAARIATLEMELEERKQRIVQMRREYGALEADKEQAATEAGQEAVERLLKRLSGPLAALAGLTSMSEAGDEVETTDLVQLIRGVEKVLARAGLEQIGTVGEQTEFDDAGHQRMSGGGVKMGTAVTVRLPGYRMGQKILIKAMVSAQEDNE